MSLHHHHARLEKISNPDASKEELVIKESDTRKRIRHLNILVVLVNKLRLNAPDLDTRRQCEAGLRSIGVLTEAEDNSW
jgi:hypothetical protein